MAILLFLFYFLLFSASFRDSASLTNVTIVGTVFCDACSENTFSKHSYFLQGARVQIVCEFSTKSASGEEITINTERITDKYGVYKLEIPPVDGFECREGRSLESFCKSSLIQSSSPLCNVPSLRSSNDYLAVKAGGEFNSCVYDFSALSYKPVQRDNSICGIKRAEDASSLVSVAPENSMSALFFWPPFFPWPNCPLFPFPFPFSNPPAFPFPFSLPFPFSNPPSLPFHFPTFPPLLPFSPIPVLLPPPPPPAFLFPLPPLPPLLPFLSPPSPVP